MNCSECINCPEGLAKYEFIPPKCTKHNPVEGKAYACHAYRPKNGAGYVKCCFCGHETRTHFPTQTYECVCGAIGTPRDFNHHVVEWRRGDKGLKFDTDKPRLGEMVKDFGWCLRQVCKVWEFGANKYSKSNWKLVENAEDRYTNAMIRHLDLEDIEGIDKETKLHHCLHVAWNAIARVYFILKEERDGCE